MDDSLGPSAIITAAPDSADLAREEILSLRLGAHLLAELSEGVLLIGLPEGFPTLVDTWRTLPPIFVRHVCPVQQWLPLPSASSSLMSSSPIIDALRERVVTRLAAQCDADLPFSVQTRVLTGQPVGPYDVNTALAEAMIAQRNAPLDVRHPAQVLSVVLADYEGVSTGFLGISRVEDNLSSWAGGARRFAREAEQLSRAEFKLLEALEVFGIELPTRGLALDLGAAPGGWTRIARARGMRVVAVDPAQLAPALKNDTGVRHERITAEAYHGRGSDRFDVILNDMRMDARDSARLTVDYARMLRPGGMVVLTLKLPEANQRVVLDSALRILRQRYEMVAARQLFHNRSEVTVCLRLGSKRNAPSPV